MGGRVGGTGAMAGLRQSEETFMELLSFLPGHGMRSGVGLCGAHLYPPIHLASQYGVFLL